MGVSGGATRAALTLHQARRNNMADVSAKDGSQVYMLKLFLSLFHLHATILLPLFLCPPPHFKGGGHLYLPVFIHPSENFVTKVEKLGHLCPIVKFLVYYCFDFSKFNLDLHMTFIVKVKLLKFTKIAIT